MPNLMKFKPIEPKNAALRVEVLKAVITCLKTKERFSFTATDENGNGSWIVVVVFSIIVIVVVGVFMKTNHLFTNQRISLSYFSARYSKLIDEPETEMIIKYK
ncbi:hypothetical protein RF11_05751 [Thelohanellus kitauei]|uniref:Uncharacterized protein n=1 Tax=Thelohanellus kitauei TaxID=669202 RepID=A0A0C2NKM9_THEKT|nr:hypothetical protein RF11_05751 [Thelohanellus kitauei]